MKRSFVFVLLSCVTAIALWGTASAQERQSPADSVAGKIGNASVQIRYSSPAVKSRKIWGELVPYRQVWRSGANEATTFQSDKDVMVEGKKLAAGKYSLFTIPGEKDWTVIFNKTAEQWGAYKYDAKEDVLRVVVQPRKATALRERLSYGINKNGIALMWENLEVPVSIK